MNVFYHCFEYCKKATMEQTYAQFLTPENVKQFALFAFEHDLMRNEHFIRFFTELAKNVEWTNSAKKTCKLKCLECCVNVQEDVLPDGCALTFAGIPYATLFGVPFLMTCICFEMSPRNECEIFMNDYTECLRDTCRTIETGICCKNYIEQEYEHMRTLRATPPTFLTTIHNTFMQKNYHEMLLNYPPYVLFCMNSQMFLNKWMNFTITRGFEETREQKLIAHKRDKPIDEGYDENALFWFILTPEYQTQILSHTMTYGNSCCAFCGTIDEHVKPRMRDIIENNNQSHHNVIFAGDKPYQHTFNNIIFALFLKSQTTTADVHTRSLHGRLLHIIAYREFLYNFSQMTCRMMFLHEMVFSTYDAKNVGDCVIGDEYLVRSINRFL